MRTPAAPYRHQVIFLPQSFFIRDNRAGLLLHAHKYDVDIRFFQRSGRIHRRRRGRGRPGRQPVRDRPRRPAQYAGRPATTLHLRANQLQPDLAVIPDDAYRRQDALARVMKKNTEADPVRETVPYAAKETGRNRIGPAQGA